MQSSSSWYMSTCTQISLVYQSSVCIVAVSIILHNREQLLYMTTVAVHTISFFNEVIYYEWLNSGHHHIYQS